MEDGVFATGNLSSICFVTPLPHCLYPYKLWPTLRYLPLNLWYSVQTGTPTNATLLSFNVYFIKCITSNYSFVSRLSKVMQVIKYCIWPQCISEALSFALLFYCPRAVGEAFLRTHPIYEAYFNLSLVPFPLPLILPKCDYPSICLFICL